MNEKETLKALGLLFTDYNYIATDEIGDVYLHYSKPTINKLDKCKSHWYSTDWDNYFILPINLPYCKAKSWDKSLRKLR